MIRGIFLRALHPHHEPHDTGFTLLELMVTVSITGLMLVMVIPAFGRIVQSWRLNGEADCLAGALREARSAAVMKNTSAVFKFDMAHDSYHYFRDDDGDGLRDAGEYQSATHVLPPGMGFLSYSFSGPTIVFEARGNTFDSGSITIHNSRNSTKKVTIFAGSGNVVVD